MRLLANPDLLVVVIAALLAAFALELPFPLAIRLPLGIVAVLLLPGYAIGVALFPGPNLDGPERSALSLALSLGVVAVGTPLLNLTPAGLAPDAIVIAVTGVTLLGTMVAWWRRRGRQSAVRGPAGRSLFALVNWGTARRRAVGLGVFVTLAVALLVFVVPTSPQAATEFFLLGPEGNVNALPGRVAVGTPTTIALGISSREGSTEPYRIVVESASARLAELGPIPIAPGTTWTGDIQFTLSAPGDDQVVRILLFKGSDVEPYRTLRLELNAIAPA
jgi:uncharacterized membrane protein